MPTLHLIIIGAMLEVLYLTLYLAAETLAAIATFIAVNGAAYLLLAYTIHVNRNRPEEDRAERQRLWLIVGFAVLFRLTLLPHGPIASDDIYRYLWDGKVAAAGINPYHFAPLDSRLAFLHSADLPAKINFPEMRTIYPPLAQGVFLAAHLAFGESIWGLKLLLVLCDLVTILVLLKTLTRMGTNPEAIVLYAWSPLPIMYFALDGHIDALGIPFLLLFVHSLYGSRRVHAAVALGLAGLAKSYPLFLSPLLLEKAASWRRVWVAAFPAAMVAVGYLCFWNQSSGGLFESLAVFGSTFAFNGLGYTILRGLLNSAAATHLVCAVAFGGCLVLIFCVKRPVLEKIFLTWLCFALLSPVVHPWYLTWLAALLTLRWSVSVFTLLGFSNLSNLVVYWHRASGVWENRAWLVGVEYLPFLVLLFWEVKRGGFSADAEIGCRPALHRPNSKTKK